MSPTMPATDPSQPPSTDPVQFDTDRDESGRTLLRIRGRLDVNTTSRVWDRVLRALPNKGDVTLDASGLSYCDGSGFSLIHEIASRQRRAGAELAVEGLSDPQQSFLDLTDLDKDLVVDAPCPSHRPFPTLVGAATEHLLKDVASLVAYVGEITMALVQVVVRPHRVRWSTVLDACSTAGAFALPVVALIGFLLGWVMSFSAAFLMRDYGAEQRLAALIGPMMVRELGPLMTCVVLAARSGSAFAAEIGTMKVNEELDALETMGIDPVRFLITPKILAAVAMTPLLTIFANIAGIVGGALVSTFILAQPLVVYTNWLQEVVSLGDIALGLSKSVVFGILVAAIGCIRGMQTESSPTGVGEATTSAVVTSIVFLAIADAIMAVIVQVLDL